MKSIAQWLLGAVSVLVFMAVAFVPFFIGVIWAMAMIGFGTGYDAIIDIAQTKRDAQLKKQQREELARMDRHVH